MLQMPQSKCPTLSKHIDQMKKLLGVQPAGCEIIFDGATLAGFLSRSAAVSTLAPRRSSCQHASYRARRSAGRKRASGVRCATCDGRRKAAAQNTSGTMQSPLAYRLHGISGHSSEETCARAEGLACVIGAYHTDMNIDHVFEVENTLLH